MMQSKQRLNKIKLRERAKLLCILMTFIGVALILERKVPEWAIWIRQWGPYALLGFFLLYVLTIVFFLPVAPIVLTIGAVYGFYSGFIINLFFAVTSALLAFLISRYIGITWLSPNKQRNLNQWVHQFQSLGWRSLALARVTPILPCAIVNYAYGLTKMKISVYTMTNLIFFIPYKLIGTYIGAHL